MFFDTHLNLYDMCYESAFIQKTTVSSFISTDISLFLPALVFGSIESVDPVADLYPTNQFLYRRVQSGTAE